MSKIEGLAKLRAKLRALPAEAKAEIRQALTQSAEEVADMARRLAPYESGDLKASIKVVHGSYTPENSNVRGVSATADGDADPDLTVSVVAGNAKAFYAAWVEFGTAAHVIKPKRPGGLLNINGRLIEQVSHPGGTPRPYFFPAWRANKRRVRGRITRATKKAAQKVAGNGQ
ncbi:HK97-gp10 family putative phage morphogenesis protein [Microvirga mediterraneensis]|uniref:HK97 gp10 family phage protein n=1 Tax=Microvirga mediterraneensis TaxID=2754695 RepID=A0A838BS04_9HYPH|nr:HK97-gp10 family putative phage morphogenesis protein [Microvirga mediterraneensis]MBA1157762.1 HK97 gp10 family phage protein [Microvirga mediterraneensis]